VFPGFTHHLESRFRRSDQPVAPMGFVHKVPPDGSHGSSPFLANFLQRHIRRFAQLTESETFTKHHFLKGKRIINLGNIKFLERIF